MLILLLNLMSIRINRENVFIDNKTNIQTPPPLPQLTFQISRSAPANDNFRNLVFNYSPYS